MNQVIFYFESISLTWHGILMALAVAAAVIISVLLAGERKRMLIAVLTAASLSCLLSTFFSKFVYWYCCYERFDGLSDALTRIGEGGHSLVGAMAGVVLSVFIAALIIRPDGGFAGLLDCVAPGGALGICIGRLASYFSLNDKGNILITDPKDQHAPLAFEIADSATGVSVWRFATFYFEAIAAVVIFVCCTYLYYTFCGAGKNRERTGSVAMIFFSLFGASQAVLESTRYDALYLRSNGFVSLMQIVSLIMVVGSMVYFSLLVVREKGLKTLYYVLWGITLALLGVCGYMEYYVQRHADMYSLCYTVMSCAMAVCVGITLFFCFSAKRAFTSDAEALSSPALKIVSKEISSDMITELTSDGIVFSDNFVLHFSECERMSEWSECIAVRNITGEPAYFDFFYPSTKEVLRITFDKVPKFHKVYEHLLNCGYKSFDLS